MHEYHKNGREEEEENEQVEDEEGSIILCGAELWLCEREKIKRELLSIIFL